uniref:Cytochrome c oxidase subunit 3 n=1 Tax=Cladotaenia vulturi TaxID=1917734 RepID=A0A1J0I2Z9_9CEST|nr:cytochrome c oxidase subunit III [Cladotaenia vulturi]APC62891.1 cytochrome c oxidase subunit III [Cladotaenia vulturi]
MSVFPLFNASFVGLFLVGLFTWNTFLICFVGGCSVISIVIYVYDSIDINFHYESAFWLFVLSEFIIFCTLLTCCLIYDVWGSVSLSNSLEIPFVGCFILLGSSITITAFHHLLNWNYSWVFLLFTVLLGILFVFLQVYELNDIGMNIFDSSFYASSFCTVGLHFSHVLLGVVGLFTLLLVGGIKFGVYRCTVLTWYWHFVDYIWLLVYTVVYVC